MGNSAIIVFTILFVLVNLCKAQIISPQKLYQRCYSQLTQSPVPINDKTMSQVKTGSLNPVDACISLLEEGNLDSLGMIKKENSLSNPVSQKILQTFHEFHRTWFAINTIEQIQDYNEEVNKGSTDVYDPNEQAYFITANLFSSNQKYSDILQGFNRLKGIRIENKELNKKIGLSWEYSHPSRRVYGANALFDINLIMFRSLNKIYDSNGDNRADEDFAAAPKIQVGDLVGIQKNTDSFTIKNMALEPLGADRAGNNEPQLNYSFDINKSFGGGVLGVPSYFMMNLGHSRGLKFNGTTKLPRRWIKAAFETFMCAQFPTLRESDITNEVIPTSETPFRKASSCVQCHSTLDQAAGVARNLTTGSSDYSKLASGKNFIAAKIPIVLTNYKQVQKATTEWIDKADPEFHIKTSKGLIHTRTLSGELLSRQIESINDLGIAMTQTNDFYTCAAKRYFEFLTGINVPLYDRKDPRNAELNRSLSLEHIEDRDFVENLGKELQRNQSLKEVIKMILKSKYYSKENFR